MRVSPCRPAASRCPPSRAVEWWIGVRVQSGIRFISGGVLGGGSIRCYVVGRNVAGARVIVHHRIGQVAVKS